MNPLSVRHRFFAVWSCLTAPHLLHPVRGRSGGGDERLLYGKRFDANAAIHSNVLTAEGWGRQVGFNGPMTAVTNARG